MKVYVVREYSLQKIYSLIKELKTKSPSEQDRLFV
jgi:hypothetical protein